VNDRETGGTYEEINALDHDWSLGIVLLSICDWAQSISNERISRADRRTHSNTESDGKSDSFALSYRLSNTRAQSFSVESQ
jgi:hypothetical protein